MQYRKLFMSIMVEKKPGVWINIKGDASVPYPTNFEFLIEFENKLKESQNIDIDNSTIVLSTLYTSDPYENN